MPFRVVRLFRGSLNSIVPAKPWGGADYLRVRGLTSAATTPRCLRRNRMAFAANGRSNNAPAIIVVGSGSGTAGGITLKAKDAPRSMRNALEGITPVNGE